VLEGQVLAHLAPTDTDALKQLLAKAHPADIAEMMDRLNLAQRKQVFAQVPPALAPKVVDEMSIETTRQVMEGLPDAEVARLLEQLPMDEVAEVLTEDLPKRKDALLALLSPAKAESVRGLLRYPAHSAGQMMTEQFATVRPEILLLFHHADERAILRRIDAEILEVGREAGKSSEGVGVSNGEEKSERSAEAEAEYAGEVAPVEHAIAANRIVDELFEIVNEEVRHLRPIHLWAEFRVAAAERFSVADRHHDHLRDDLVFAQPDDPFVDLESLVFR